MAKIVEFPASTNTPPFRTLKEAFMWADDDKKAEMIWRVTHMETINSVNKDTLRVMLKWLAEETMEVY